jgi:hypothetical protein
LQEDDLLFKDDLLLGDLSLILETAASACLIMINSRLTERLAGVVQPVRIKIDPGTKITGIAPVRQEETM